MSISKKEFKNALREGFSKEFSSVPANENDIVYTFSQHFELKMQRLIKREQKSYWNFINTASKRVAIVFGFVLILTLSMLSIKPIRVSAAKTISEVIHKVKNIYQLAYEKGIPLEEVDTAGDFKHTEFSSEDRETNKDQSLKTITGEVFENPQINIYNKMLNSIDFFSTAELSIKTSMMNENAESVIEYYTDIDSGIAYETYTENGVTLQETYAKNGEMILVDNKRREYNPRYLKTYSRADTPYIPLEQRIEVSDVDGLPCYTYRRNITNCPLASFSLLPDGMAFSYLKNLDLWEITDSCVLFLGRECIEIKGSPSPYVANKHNSPDFTMLVDSKTGILLDFKAYKNGEITNYITATKCIIDGSPKIKEFDINNYTEYKEVYR